MYRNKYKDIEDDVFLTLNLFTNDENMSLIRIYVNQ